MADLTSLDKQKLESLLKMKQGFLLNFTDASLQAFVLRSVGLNINDEKYKKGTGSKANRMREFWRLEPNLIVTKLIFDLCQYFKNLKEKKDLALMPEEQILLNDCITITKKLSNSAEIVGLLVKRKTRQTISKNSSVKGIREEVNSPSPFNSLLQGHQDTDAENETILLVTKYNVMPFLMNMK
jgi:hypothetical protein